MSDKRITVEVDLSPELALALAQFVKRVGWSEIRANAVDEDEAYDIRNALQYLRDGLAARGFAPR